MPGPNSADSRAPGGMGVIPAQDHRPVEVDERSFLYLFRVVTERTRYGEWGADREVRGDLTGATWWKASSRPISGYRFCWPSVVMARGGGAGGDTATTPENIPNDPLSAITPSGDVPPDSRTPHE